MLSEIPKKLSDGERNGFRKKSQNAANRNFELGNLKEKNVPLGAIVGIMESNKNELETHDLSSLD